MAYGPEGQSRARLADLAAAAGTYRLSSEEASAIVERCSQVVCGDFEQVCAALGVSELTRDLLWQRSIANESVFYPRD